MSFVDEDYKLCFIHVPKAAGTSVSEALKKNLLPVSYRHHNLYRWAGSGCSTLLDHQKDFNRLPDWSFAIIRNPYERCLSDWTFTRCAVLPELRYRDDWREYLDNCQSLNWSALHLAGDDSAYVGACPSHCFVSINGEIKVDTLIKMENINKVPQIIWENTGIRLGKIPSLNVTNSIRFMELLMDEESKRIIREIYAKDFELYEGV
tara:strand:- start:1702 stop:2319 length:618 start_codon:yes stop_codon:yes gene_type:complete